MRRIKRIFTNPYGVLTLEELNLKPEQGVIKDVEKSIDEILRDILLVQEIISVARANKKIKYFYVIYEDIGDELNVKDMRGYKGKARSLKKVFGKFRNIFFFIKNSIKTDFEIPTLTSVEPLEEVVPLINEDVENSNVNLPPVPLDLIGSGETMVSNDFIDGIISSKYSVLDDYDRKIQEALAARRKIINEAVEVAVGLEKEKIRAELEASRIANNIRRAKELALAKGHAIKDENGEIHFTKDVFEKEYLTEANEMQISKEIFYKTTGADRNLIDAKVYTLKSLIDFIWRMYILHFNASNIEDLLYYVGISIPTISRSQSDFIRRIAKNSNSLFDLMVKMDYELKYDGALFYVFLASIFIIKDEKVYVNRRYINSITFVEGDKIFELTNSLELLVNEIELYKEKIIYSHYIEFVNFYKSEFSKIRASLKLSDLQDAVDKRNLFFRRENIFVIILNNITLLAAMKFVNLKSVVNNPNLISEIDGRINQNISKTYIVLLSEIKNYMLLDISNYETVFEIYHELLEIDIDLVISDDPEIQARAVKLSDSIKADLAEIVNYELDMKEKMDVSYDDIEALYNDPSKTAEAYDPEAFKSNLREKLDLKKDNKFNNKPLVIPQREIINDNQNNGEDINDIVFDFEERIKNNIRKIEEERAKINRKIGNLNSNKNKNYIKIKA